MMSFRHNGRLPLGLLLMVAQMALVLTACSSTSRIANPPAELQPFQAELTVAVRWVAGLEPGVSRHYQAMDLALVDGEIYNANRQGEVAAYRQDDGEQLWRIALNVELSTGPVSAGKLLVVAAEDEVIALSRGDGSLVWRSRVSSEVVTTPLWAEERIIVRSADGVISALQQSSGEHLWRYQHPVPPLSLRGAGAPLVEGGLVVAGQADGRIIALDLGSGEQRWQSTLSVARGRSELERIVDIDARMVTHRGILYAAGYQDRVAAIIISNGKKLWERKIGSYSGLALADGILYLSANSGEIWALSARNGGSLWRQDKIQGRRPGVPVVQGNYLVVGDYDGYLHWLRREDGALVGRVRVEDSDYYFPLQSDLNRNGYPEDRALLTVPVINGRRIYIADKRGTINALEIIHSGSDTR